MKRIVALLFGCLFIMLSVVSSAATEEKKATAGGLEFTFELMEEFQDLHVVGLLVVNRADSVVFVDYRNFDAVNSEDEQINVLLPNPAGEQFDPVQALRPGAKVSMTILFDPASEFKLSKEKPLLLYYAKDLLFKVYK